MEVDTMTEDANLLAMRSTHPTSLIEELAVNGGSC
ncbi:hypothetical protein Pr1d_38210 [Bythopirellula goksoeyrii]|uniref:Uncharacterized protein n=1 Tax=Bythopirellula goksoeyrii TaxID=1400387 RepID=A0A5B9QBT0_9BACT|nr:hypothetical protein Pr1d_38210 [Bythopirellula goksoeyrii]